MTATVTGLGHRIVAASDDNGFRSARFSTLALVGWRPPAS